jgi:Rne/Rng family ribonuclease
MTRELFVSSTPHETKVGMVEDDLLAEIYLERENEYTLAGSIYKGRVTRVLPGMQSAFVDIGLERDAFLYVSDFMELPEEDEVEDIPIPSQRNAQPQLQMQAESPSEVEERPAHEASHTESQPSGNPERSSERSGERERPGEEDQQGGRGDWQSRRRRRGRRGMPQDRFARPASNPEPARNDRPERPERNEYGAPPGYQPIVLPGESISKYRGRTQTPAPPVERPAVAERAAQPASAFPDDEPLFADPMSADPIFADPSLPLPGVTENEDQTAPTGRARAASVGNHEAPSLHPAQREASPWDPEQQRPHKMNIAAVFGGDATETEEDEKKSYQETTEREEEADRFAHPAIAAAAGTLEEEEIEEEEVEGETDLAAYVEDLDEGSAFEEMEEETQHAADYRPQQVSVSEEAAPQAAASSSFEVVSSEPVTGQVELGEGAEEEAEEDAEEAELEEAQAEAEALLDAEARGDAAPEARAEVRAPSATAGYTQRAPRPAFDRRGPRGRRGGRRFRRQEPQNIPQITDLLKEGQEILVQIAKEPIAKKGARITSHIALPGRFLVYMPTVNHTGVSRKISSEEERQRLKRIIISERENGHGGFIVRTAAQGASEEDLRADIRFLKGLWSEIKTRAESGKSPALIYHDLNVVERVLRDQVTSDFAAVWVDNEQEYERVLRFANRFQPGLVKRVKLYTKETPLFDQFGLSEEINKALKSKVWLKSGGYIVINQTEALVAIDVNTGKYVGKTARLEDTIVKTNVDAIKEIVRQIRLRDLGGIIIIDFIDMDERRNRQKVMQALEEALRSDRAPSKVLQFNDFGLVAITRKRVKQSLERTIGTPCPYCQSTGFVKSAMTVCNEIYLEMRKMARHLEHADVMLRVNPEVAKVLKSNNGRLLGEMEEMTKKTVIVKSDPALHQEQFDVN